MYIFNGPNQNLVLKQINNPRVMPQLCSIIIIIQGGISLARHPLPSCGAMQPSETTAYGVMEPTGTFHPQVLCSNGACHVISPSIKLSFPAGFLNFRSNVPSQFMICNPTNPDRLFSVPFSLDSIQEEPFGSAPQAWPNTKLTCRSRSIWPINLFDTSFPQIRSRFES